MSSDDQATAPDPGARGQETSPAQAERRRNLRTTLGWLIGFRGSNDAGEASRFSRDDLRNIQWPSVHGDDADRQRTSRTQPDIDRINLRTRLGQLLGFRGSNDAGEASRFFGDAQGNPRRITARDGGARGQETSPTLAEGRSNLRTRLGRLVRLRRSNDTEESTPPTNHSSPNHREIESLRQSNSGSNIVQVTNQTPIEIQSSIGHNDSLHLENYFQYITDTRGLPGNLERPHSRSDFDFDGKQESSTAKANDADLPHPPAPPPYSSAPPSPAHLSLYSIEPSSHRDLPQYSSAPQSPTRRNTDDRQERPSSSRSDDSAARTELAERPRSRDSR